MNFSVGETHKAWISSRQYKVHIVGVVDKYQVVFKWYGKHKQWWHYQVMSFDELEFKITLAKDRAANP